MNENWMIFFVGLLVGGAIFGYGIFKIEEDRILILESDQQKAIIEAQNKVIAKEAEGQTITQKVSAEYEAKIAALNSRPAASGMQNSSKHGMSPVPAAAKRTYDSCAAVKIQLTALQEWIREQVLAFNKP